MTLDEAIIHAEQVADSCAVTDGNLKCEREHRQLVKWLKELKRLRASGSEDLISRQNAIEAMWKALYAYEDLTEKQFMEHEELELKDWFLHRIFVQRMHEECMKAVEALPSRITEYKTFCGVPIEEAARIVQEHNAEPKTGEWIKAKGMMPPEFHGHHCCSECGNFANMEPPFGNREDLSRYCPNCGAKMCKGGEEE